MHIPMSSYVNRLYKLYLPVTNFFHYRTMSIQRIHNIILIKHNYYKTPQIATIINSLNKDILSCMSCHVLGLISNFNRSNY